MRDQEPIHRLASHAHGAPAERGGRGRRTYHDTCPGVADKVQLPVDLADVVSLGADGAVERDHVAVLVLQLGADDRSASRSL